MNSKLILPIIICVLLSTAAFAAVSHSPAEVIPGTFQVGSYVFQGLVNFSGNRITGLSAPVDDSDAATKAYVDASAGSSNYIAADTYFAVGGDPNYCKKRVVDSYGHATDTFVNDYLTCDMTTRDACMNGICNVSMCGAPYRDCNGDGTGTDGDGCETVGSCTGYDVFVYSTARGGNLGGVSGADALCQGEADLLGYSGTFYAWVSTSTSSPSARFTQYASPLYNTRGDKVADNWADLIDGSLDNAIVYTYEGKYPGSSVVWSSTNSDGSYSGSHNCNSWSTDHSGTYGEYGYAGYTSSSWTNTGSINTCNNIRTFYCFEQ